MQELPSTAAIAGSPMASAYPAILYYVARGPKVFPNLDSGCHCLAASPAASPGWGERDPAAIIGD